MTMPEVKPDQHGTLTGYAHPPKPTLHRGQIMTTADEYTGPVRFDEIDRQIAWAEAESKKGKQGLWDQKQWGVPTPCGTAFCIAGHVAAEAGYRPVYEGNWLLLLAPGVNSKSFYVQDVARDMLGIRRFDIDDDGDIELFDFTNSIADLKRIRDDYARAEGYPTKYETP